MNENQIGTIIVNCAVQLHREIGPGLLQTVYEAVLAKRLSRQGLKIARQVPVKILIAGEEFEEGFRADLIIEGKVIVELKSVESVSPAYKKQLLTCLKLTGLNFGDALTKNGITRSINVNLEP